MELETNNNNEKPLVISYLRWSTAGQKLGDSERRQIKAANEWLKAKGYELDESHVLEDDGKSGYHSENFGENGALGKFAKKVKKGEIPKGTILLIEDFSRFSRAKVSLAQERFLSLVNNGILVHVLKDNKTYTQEGDFTDFLMSMAKMQAAHEESDRKSNHLNEFWADRRQKALENKDKDEYPVLLPATAPDWIKKVKRNGNTYLELIPERVEVIKYIFQLSDTGGADGLGMGSSLVARKLEQEGIRPFTGEKKNTAMTFSDSYIVRLLNDRRLLGFFQPHINPICTETGKRTRQKSGEEIPNYFPPVIDQETFNRVREKIDQRKNYQSGKVAKRFNNLFTKIVKCSRCGHSMGFYSKRGSKAEGGRSNYLQCNEGTRHLKCGNKAVRYFDTFEPTILHSINEMDLSHLFNNSNENNDREIHLLREQEKQLTDDIAKLDRKIINATKMYFDNPDDTHIRDSRIECIEEQKALKHQLEETKQKILSSRVTTNYDDFKSNLERVLSTQEIEDDVEAYSLRKAINTYLIDIIQYIAIDGVTQEAWVVFDIGFFKQQIENQHKLGQELIQKAMAEGDFEKYFPTGPLYDENGVDISGSDNHTAKPFTETDEKELNAFGLGDTPHIKIKLKRFKDEVPTYNDLLELRTGFQFATDELIKINELCNVAVNRNWKMKKRINYQVLTKEESEKLIDDINIQHLPPEDLFDENGVRIK